MKKIVREAVTSEKRLQKNLKNLTESRDQHIILSASCSLQTEHFLPVKLWQDNLQVSVDLFSVNRNVSVIHVFLVSKNKRRNSQNVNIRVICHSRSPHRTNFNFGKHVKPKQ